MNGDAGLVGCLVERLTNKLPHRTGAPTQEFSQDEIVCITRATLVKISANSIRLVFDALLALLEDAVRPHGKTINSHPPHVLLSELYVLELLADCCASNWYRSKDETNKTPGSPAPEPALSSAQRAAFPRPRALANEQVHRLFDVLKVLFEPIPDNYSLPAKAILDDSSAKHVATPGAEDMARTPLSASSNEPAETRNLLQAHAGAIEASIKLIMEYVTASSWAGAFDLFRNVMYTARNHMPPQNGAIPTAATAEEERAALVMMRLVSFFWADGHKLSLVVQEFCSSFLHFRKAFQNTIAVVVPQIITRWLDRHPGEFVQLHSTAATAIMGGSGTGSGTGSSAKRRENAPDTLFDMSLTIGDQGRRKTLLYPMQMTLLFLQPDVFEVASNMRDAKGSGIAKKVQFLDGLRKALRNRNEQAAYCLVLLLRAARHFDAESDSALMSYAMDVQDEVRDAVFRRITPGTEGVVLYEQDILTAAFVSLTHLNFDYAVDSLAVSCLSSSAPHSFRIAVIQACAHFARLEGGDSALYQPLFRAASSFVQGQLQTMADLLADGYINEQSAQRKAVESAPCISMACNILSFLDASPATLFEGPPTDPDEREIFYQENLNALIACLIAADENVRRLAASVAGRLFACEQALARIKSYRAIGSDECKTKFWRLTSLILISICDRTRLPCNSEALRSISSYLESRLLLLTSIPELGQTSDEIPERTAASGKLEKLFLVSLCSAEIEACQTVTQCIGTFLQECHLIDSGPATVKSSLTLLRNADIFREISSREFRFTGIVAFQKRIRGLLRRMQYPSAGILDAWEFVFDKWLQLSMELSQAGGQGPPATERMVAEWRNYSGFLASLGGICTAEQATNLEEPAISGLKWIDRFSAGDRYSAGDNDDEPLLARYLRLSIQLLACANVRVRETMREVLSSEVPTSLFQPLFKALEAELDVLFAGALEPSVRGSQGQQGQGADNDIIFAEQSSSLLKALVERLDSSSEVGAASSLHLGALCLNFAKSLEGIIDTPSSLRVKIKICQLVEAVTKRKEQLNLRDDVHVRNQLLEYIFSWIARPRSPRDSAAAAALARQEEMLRFQRDLDNACLRSLSTLTFRLPLQPGGDGTTDVGMSEQKSQMFHSYFNRFLSLLNMDSNNNGSIDAAGGRGDYGYHGYHHGYYHGPHHHYLGPAVAGGGGGVGGGAIGGSSSSNSEASTSDLAITILSNLLSANIDVGLKHSLSIGYHENWNIRKAFIRVLYNILVQGTEFSNLSDAAVNEKYDKLLEIVTSDPGLAVAMAGVCPSHDVDELTISLLNIFEARGSTLDLLEALIKQEVEETSHETELLRRSSVAIRMLIIYTKWKGAAYLRDTLQGVIDRVIATSQDMSLELDPERVSSQEELAANVNNLQLVSRVFIDNICHSVRKMPPVFRKICNIISETAAEKFPDSKYTAVGSFIFLRFFCPAIVTPENEGLLSEPPSRETRRGLLLIAKVIQNLANNMLFGAKEPYMFPLVDFLTENIWTVTTFLREISIPPPPFETPPAAESFEFGSCVALHRFLYEHWDLVRQRLVAREKKEFVRSPAESTRSSRSPVLEPLRNLIMNLGPPPLAVTWNRPQIPANSPPSYSRFQDFMLRNAFRGTESFLTARAVYDAGESKDGLSIICIILRHIDGEAIDFDTMIYCYLKIASRLWDRPFALLIDSTYYTGVNEPKDELFHKIDQLTPRELSDRLRRIYIYNLNSASKKCLRRILRVSAKNEGHVFSPARVEYRLLGTLQDLQVHFHLSQLVLPRETVAVVTDTRYVFQPVTRLSKSKGKVDVQIKVGHQFVQVTTAQVQDMPGFRQSTTVNDIFRLGDVDEAPTAIQTEDNSAFGLKADGGRVVMYFTSPHKAEILATLRGAKARHARDTRGGGKSSATSLLLEQQQRLIRPQDVPGTLLNLALTNLATPDPVLRLSSYNLLSALCKAFKFSAATSRLLSAREIAIPLDPSRFIIDISRSLAQTEPQLTADFLNEFFVGWDSFLEEQKPLSLAYMAPWIPGLRTSLLASETESDKGKEKIAGLFRKLLDVAVTDPTLAVPLEQTVWPAIAQDEVLLDVFIDEVVKAALSLGFEDEQTETLTSIAAAIGTVTLRGKIVSRLRKGLNRTSLRPTRHLPDNPVWNELCVLLQFCLALSFDSGVQAQMYLPEIFHAVTMLANTGPPDVRAVVHRLLTNTLHSASTAFVALDEDRSGKLRATLDTLSDPKSSGDIFIHVHPSGHGHSAGGGLLSLRDGAASMSTHTAGAGEASPTLAATEALATVLFETCAVAAPSVDLANAWRARWMSLVASTAFQNNPAIQPRAFTVMGCLAREEVDDDLLYQVLVALRHSVGRFGEDILAGNSTSATSSSDMLVAIVTALSKMMAKLPSASRYGVQLFWLAISLLRLVPFPLFNCTALFLEAVLANISTTPDIRDSSSSEQVVAQLLRGRVPLEQAASLLDEAYGIHFTSENFHYAACACLVRGLTDSVTRATALRVLSTFLVMTVPSSSSSTAPGPATGPRAEHNLHDLLASPYMALMLARTTSAAELHEHLWAAGINVSSSSSSSSSLSPTTTDSNNNNPNTILDPTLLRAEQDLSPHPYQHRPHHRPHPHPSRRLKDKDLLLNTAIELVDFACLDDAVQLRSLRWLQRVAVERPGVAVHLCAGGGLLVPLLNDVLLHCQSSATVEAAQALLRTVMGSARFVTGGGVGAGAGLNEILEDMGFAGLWRSCSFTLAQEPQDRSCFALTEKLIEVSFFGVLSSLMLETILTDYVTAHHFVIWIADGRTEKVDVCWIP
ncbi:uncharacterized protein C8A04DRAFT_11820 [Dichotomopilus funicola]|uniref:Ras-GAP domain-containing protein n=1 Tax=Dichotomopilus funicola TaxID=1934379 RepID=A0AAN6V5Z2_9PEZI|nr:hypothetical protein C8A04DRAFT_11820 [Dichotomopilus funicola]